MIPSENRACDFVLDPMKIGKGINGTHEGLMEKNVLAVMGVIYFAFDTKIAENFVKHTEEYHHK